MSSSTLEGSLKDLVDGENLLKQSSLLKLSGLSGEEINSFAVFWADLELERKQETLARLGEFSEDNIELDFTAVFLTCLDDDDQEVRELAAQSLWECEDRIVIRPLISLLNHDPSAKVRAAVATTLGKFADIAQTGKLLKRDAERVQEALLSVMSLENEEPDVWRRAMESVASFNSPDIERIILQAHYSADLKLKQSAIYAMGRTSDSKWVPTLLQEMNHEDPAIRYEAASACGQLGDEGTVPHLIGLVKDDDIQVQVSAVQALGAVGGELAKTALIQCLEFGDEAVEEGLGGHQTDPGRSPAHPELFSDHRQASNEGHPKRRNSSNSPGWYEFELWPVRRCRPEHCYGFDGWRH